MNNNISTIDLFCGIGGLSYGLKQAGLAIRAGIDLDNSCQFSFEKNIGSDFISEDISEIKGEELIKKYWNRNDEIKILVGCAPCQPFSTHANKKKNKEANEKWHLLNQFERLISETNPDIVSMENVPNLQNKEIFKNFETFLKKNFYYVSYSNIYCPDYGIPQKRRRLVLVASKYGKLNIIPPTHSKESYITTRDVIGNMPKITSKDVCITDPLHKSSTLSEINIKRIQSSKPNGTWLDWDEELRLECHKRSSGHSYKSVYGRMSWDEPSPTITTQFYNYGTGRFGHPSQDRALTIREGAILQTFPHDYKFYEKEEDISITKLGRHIGNAVPVKLGFVIGKSIIKHLEDHGKY